MFEKVVALTPGWEATRRQNWFPNTAQQFEEAGYRVIFPKMPRRGTPSQETSLGMLTAGIGDKKDIVLVGHSCHARTTLHYALLPSSSVC